jgi:hypothetical protein
MDKVKTGFRTEGMTGNWISERISAVKKSFERALGQNTARLYCVQTQGKNNNRCYFIALDQDQIEII